MVVPFFNSIFPFKELIIQWESAFYKRRRKKWFLFYKQFMAKMKNEQLNCWVAYIYVPPRFNKAFKKVKSINEVLTESFKESEVLKYL